MSEFALANAALNSRLHVMTLHVGFFQGTLFGLGFEGNQKTTTSFGGSPF